MNHLVDGMREISGYCKNCHNGFVVGDRDDLKNIWPDYRIQLQGLSPRQRGEAIKELVRKMRLEGEIPCPVCLGEYRYCYQI